MTRKPPVPKTKSVLSRKARQAYERGIAAGTEKIALLEGDAAAILRQARRRAEANVDAVARTMPTAERAKITRYAKKGVRKA
jgi:hypothetical protein